MKSRTFYKLSADKLRNILPVNPCYDDIVEDKAHDAPDDGRVKVWLSDG